MLVIERQAENVEHDAGDEVEQKDFTVESDTERATSVEEDLPAEDTKPTEDSEKDETEDADVEKEVWETVVFVMLRCITVSVVVNWYTVGQFFIIVDALNKFTLVC